jgi:hypothetical protein
MQKAVSAALPHDEIDMRHFVAFADQGFPNEHVVDLVAVHRDASAQGMGRATV